MINHKDIFEQLLNNPNGQDIPWIIFNIGQIFHSQNKWKEALEYYEQAIDQMRNNKPSRTKDSVHVLQKIALILKQQEKYDEGT